MRNRIKHFIFGHSLLYKSNAVLGADISDVEEKSDEYKTPYINIDVQLDNGVSFGEYEGLHEICEHYNNTTIDS